MDMAGIDKKISDIEVNNYMKFYQQNHFKETTDKFQNADIKRKCTAQTYKSAINLLSNDSSCLLLNENLSSYSIIIDEKGKDASVNNYADIIDMLKPNLKCTNPKTWKSSLQISLPEPATLLEPLPHEKNANCYLHIKEDHIKELYKSMSFVHQNNNLDSSSVEENNDNKINKLFLPNQNITNTTAQSKQIQYKYKTKANISNKQINQPNSKQVKVENSCAFRTAKDELFIQKQNSNKNTKSNKSMHSSNLIQPVFSGGQKKGLGAGLGRGVQSKFISPDLKEEPIQYDNKELIESEGIVDERLKNIDSKMVELIRSEIMDSGDMISWDDIAGLEFAKKTIQEIVVWPLLRPDIFTGLRRPPKGILLFGPPGTGKTLIGKCIASQSQSTFFSISASSLTSKWIGDGEKMVRALFAVARCHQPAVIFIDEIDSLLTQRSDSEHESSRRIKTEFLVQLDGAATGDDDRILVIGATNRPQELDEAARRRLVRRLYIPLPEIKARKQIVLRLMSSENHILTENDVDEISELTNGYSGADMKNLCAEASLGPIRSIDMSLIHNIQPDQVRPINITDFKAALTRIRASVSGTDLDQYVIWDNTYGSGIH